MNGFVIFEDEKGQQLIVNVNQINTIAVYEKPDDPLQEGPTTIELVSAQEEAKLNSTVYLAMGAGNQLKVDVVETLQEIAEKLSDATAYLSRRTRKVIVRSPEFVEPEPEDDDFVEKIVHHTSELEDDISHILGTGD